jgi:23S rRNA pseudouridine1911/1915/1917 synthase
MIPDPPGSQSFRLVAAPEDAGKRADRFLADSLTALSRSRVKALIEAGLARRDDQALSEPSESVRAGAAYTLVVPPAAPATPAGESIPFPVLFEDGDILVLDKPAGLVVHPAPGNETGTLVNAVIAHCGPSLVGVGAERRPGIVHRLDKDTSGVMVVAKNDLAMHALTTLFATRRDLDRGYLALCWGVPQPREGDIAGAIGRDARDRKRMAIRLHGGGKDALTHYQVRRAFGAAVAETECRLATGRTHQIRVHLASRGHPIVGDPLYLRRIPAPARLLPPDLRTELLDFPRQALHAARLGFPHPRTGERLVFETPPPADMVSLITRLCVWAGLPGVQG